MMEKISKNIKSFFKLYYDQGTVAPWYKGFCYYDHQYHRVILFFIPLNILIRLGRNLWTILIRAGMDATNFYEDQFQLHKDKIRTNRDYRSTIRRLSQEVEARTARHQRAESEIDRLRNSKLNILIDLAPFPEAKNAVYKHLKDGSL